MRAVILAAGMGKRLMPLTQDRPKCMVSYQNRAIIDYVLKAFVDADISEVYVVGGYEFETLKTYLKGRVSGFFENPRYETTNMLYTLFCARELMQSCRDAKKDCIISYADIVFDATLLQKLKMYQGAIGVAINTDWERLWKKRFADPLQDAETLKILDGKIREIGKKPRSLDEIQGQYMGVFKISYEFIDAFLHIYDGLKTKMPQQEWENLFMTDFLQNIIEQFDNVEPILIDGGWCEIDTKEDLLWSY